jgi:hypothetical protein
MQSNDNSYPLAIASALLICGAMPLIHAQEDSAHDNEPTDKPALSDGSKEPASPLPKIKRINETTYQIGEILIDKKNRTISFDAEAEITKAGDLQEVNSIEYVVVTNMGKIHEALFVTTARPIHLNIAFKLLGYKENKSLFREFNGNFPTEKYQTTSEEDKARSYFTTTVSWTDPETKKSHSHNLNDLLITEETKKTFAEDKVKWSYGGSFIHQGKFAAELNNDLIAILTDRAAVANYVGKNGEQGMIWLPVSEKLPIQGTKVKLTITPDFPIDQKNNLNQ